MRRFDYPGLLLAQVMNGIGQGGCTRASGLCLKFDGRGWEWVIAEAEGDGVRRAKARDRALDVKSYEAFMKIKRNQKTGKAEEGWQKTKDRTDRQVARHDKYNADVAHVPGSRDPSAPYGSCIACNQRSVITEVGLMAVAEGSGMGNIWNMERGHGSSTRYGVTTWILYMP